MSQKTILLLVTVFILIVIGMFVFSFLKKSELTSEPLVVTPIATTTNPYGITRIDAKHFFNNGVHTVVGEIPMPTPCDLVTTTAAVAESMPEQITLDFSVLNNSETCAQVMTTQRFKVEATASNAASISARFMGQPVELNLVEAKAGETPEAFELYIKG